MKNFILSWGMLMVSVLFNAYGVFVMKLKLNELGAIQLDSFQTVLSYFLILMKSPLIISGVILFFIAPFVFVIALSRMEIVVAYPIQIGLNFLFLVLLALIFLGEKITVYKLIGILLILIGMYFLSKSG